MSEILDVAVVGAGVVGSCAAYHLMKNRVRTLLLEQFEAGHRRGSSHGSSRITRRAYVESYYVKMMEEAYKIWEELEAESETKLYIPTGILVFGKEGSASDLEDVISCLKISGTDHEVLSSAEANKRYPPLKIPNDYGCVFENDGGILLADKAVKAIQDQFKKLGGKLMDHCQVEKIEPGTVVTLRTSKGTIRARKVILTPGAWAGQMSSQLGFDLPLKVVRTEVFYWKCAVPEMLSSSHFPTFWYTPPEAASRQRMIIYGLPSHEYPGLIKICPGHTEHTGPLLDHPEDMRNENSTPHSLQEVADFVGKYFYGISTIPSIHETCLYTATPDHNPIIDYHPKHPNIIFGMGFSGHGFKLSPVMGKVLCEMAMEQPVSHDISPFRLKRFISKALQAHL